MASSYAALVIFWPAPFFWVRAKPLQRFLFPAHREHLRKRAVTSFSVARALQTNWQETSQ